MLGEEANQARESGESLNQPHPEDLLGSPERPSDKDGRPAQPCLGRRPRAAPRSRRPGDDAVITGGRTHGALTAVKDQSPSSFQSSSSAKAFTFAARPLRDINHTPFAVPGSISTKPTACRRDANSASSSDAQIGI